MFSIKKTKLCISIITIVWLLGGITSVQAMQQQKKSTILQKKPASIKIIPVSQPETKALWAVLGDYVQYAAALKNASFVTSFLNQVFRVIKQSKAQPTDTPAKQIQPGIFGFFRWVQEHGVAQITTHPVVTKLKTLQEESMRILQTSEPGGAGIPYWTKEHGVITLDSLLMEAINEFSSANITYKKDLSWQAQWKTETVSGISAITFSCSAAAKEKGKSDLKYTNYKCIITVKTPDPQAPLIEKYTAEGGYEVLNVQKPSDTKPKQTETYTYIIERKNIIGIQDISLKIVTTKAPYSPLTLQDSCYSWGIKSAKAEASQTTYKYFVKTDGKSSYVESKLRYFLAYLRSFWAGKH